MRRQLRPHFEEYATGRTPPWYNHLGMALTSLALNFYASSFAFLSWENTLKVWTSTYFYGLAGTAFFMLVPPLVKLIPGHRAKLKAHKQAVADRLASTAKHALDIKHKLDDVTKAVTDEVHKKHK